MSVKLEDLKSRCVVKINAPITATLTTASTWYTLADTTKLISCSVPYEFTLNSTTGKLTYTGTRTDKIIQFIGDADFSSDTINVKVTLGLFKNGILVDYATTPSDFTATNRINSIGINDLVGNVQPNDYFEVKAMSDTDSVTITLNSFHTTYLAIY